MEIKKCELCGKKIKTFSIKLPYHNNDTKEYIYNYFHCCGYYKQDIFLQNSEIKKLYNEDYDDFNQNFFFNIIKNIATKIKANSFKKYIINKKVLEVGSSTGSFLKNCIKYNPKVLKGIEISNSATKISKKRLPNVDIENVSFENFKTKKKYDSIFMFHVIEHFRDPLLATKKAYRLLNKKGVLILETPNWNSWEQLFFKKLWYGWQVPFHTYLFSIESLKKLVKNAGFKVLKIEQSLVPNSWVGSLKRRFPIFKKLGILILPFYIFFLLPTFLAAVNQKSGRITIYAYKK